MMEGVTLTEFLLARIAEDEEVAKACAEVYPPPWDVSDRGHTATVRADEPNFWVVAELQQHPSVEGWLGDRLDHIARHDPARVLAECEAKRRIVALHESWPVLVDRTSPAESVTSDLAHMTFSMSRQIAWQTEQEYRARFGDEPPTAPMLAALAAVYSDHPDYDQTWRP